MFDHRFNRFGFDVGANQKWHVVLFRNANVVTHVADANNVRQFYLRADVSFMSRCTAFGLDIGKSFSRETLIRYAQWELFATFLLTIFIVWVLL